MREDETLSEHGTLVLVALAVPERVQLLGEADISRFGHDTVLVQAGEDTNWVGQFNEVNGWLEIAAKVDELPLDLLSRVLFLF